MDELNAHKAAPRDTSRIVPQAPANSEFVTQGSQKIYDPGESVVAKANREGGVFDRDLFFQDLFENYLICVQQKAERRRPSGVVLKWDTSTSFDDFLSDSIEEIDRKLESVKFAKAVGAQKMHNLDESLLSEIKIDAGSAQVGKRVGAEDYDALYEILRRAKEHILEYKAGRLNLIINQKTGRVRTTVS